MLKRVLERSFVFCVLFGIACGEDEDDMMALPRADGGGDALRNPGKKRVFFLNFDGPDLKPAKEADARKNECDIIRKPVTAAVFDFNGFGPDRATAVSGLVDIVSGFVIDFDIDVVPVRPQTGEYTMVVVGGYPEAVGFPDRVRGVAPLDCNDATSSDVVFAFSAAFADDFADSVEWARQALSVAIVQEAAHALGLVHTNNAKDVMYPYVQRPPRQDGFREGNVLSPPSCPNSGTFQDSYDQMLIIAGPRSANAVFP